MPALLLTGIGISLVCGLSVISGSVQKGGTFIRTTRADPRIGREYDKGKKRILRLFAVGEITMGIYLIIDHHYFMADRRQVPCFPGWVPVPLGFFFVAFYHMFEQIVARKER